jgi:hypothetical protein
VAFNVELNDIDSPFLVPNPIERLALDHSSGKLRTTISTCPRSFPRATSSSCVTPRQPFRDSWNEAILLCPRQAPWQPRAIRFLSPGLPSELCRTRYCSDIQCDTLGPKNESNANRFSSSYLPLKESSNYRERDSPAADGARRPCRSARSALHRISIAAKSAYSRGAHDLVHRRQCPPGASQVTQQR